MADAAIAWARPPSALVFCAVVARDASVITACRGRWEPGAEDEIRWSVAAHERCGGCVRELEGTGARRCAGCGRPVTHEPRRVERVSFEAAPDEPGAFDHLTEGEPEQ